MMNYWDENEARIHTRYLNSLFLEKSTASNMLQELVTAIASTILYLEKLVKLSIDGANVNLKLIFDLKSHMGVYLDSEKQILDVGTCSFHTKAHKSALIKVGWE